MSLKKCGKSYGFRIVDNHKTALKFIYRVLSENINYKNYQSNLDVMHSINDRLKDICDWLNRPAGLPYYDDARRAYMLYNAKSTLSEG